jgi:hypothetical protein
MYVLFNMKAQNMIFVESDNRENLSDLREVRMIWTDTDHRISPLYVSHYLVLLVLTGFWVFCVNNTVEFVLFNTTKPCFEVKSMEITRLEIREIALY